MIKRYFRDIEVLSNMCRLGLHIYRIIQLFRERAKEGDKIDRRSEKEELGGQAEVPGIDNLREEKTERRFNRDFQAIDRQNKYEF